ncbi:hypothetical protein EGR_10284 [Echinococcus granulosus]|uniref:Uncharacterized protein n=1 Tax=Echinococcus granulosus TaxID=6210 RepID=W6U2S8_ECHGR|nr:hypothetical protein EGR_10284 [Echinococcus granulosus]EUB54866.1 hypothetical protein EGR_10284 [Echinococcus granulosus]
MGGFIFPVNFIFILVLHANVCVCVLISSYLNEFNAYALLATVSLMGEQGQLLHRKCKCYVCANCKDSWPDMRIPSQDFKEESFYFLSRGYNNSSYMDRKSTSFQPPAPDNQNASR